MPKSNKFFISIIIAAAAAVLIFITSGANIYTDWLWFQELAFERTFLIMFFQTLFCALLLPYFLQLLFI